MCNIGKYNEKSVECDAVERINIAHNNIAHNSIVRSKIAHNSIVRSKVAHNNIEWDVPQRNATPGAARNDVPQRNATPGATRYGDLAIRVALTTLIIILLSFSAYSVCFAASDATQSSSTTQSSNMSLTLSYNFGGCESNLYTAESYYVNPIVKDIYKNGSNQIIFGNYSVIVTDAAGKTIWRVNGGYDRTKPYTVAGGDIGRVNKIAVEDIDGDGKDEIIVAHWGGMVSVLTYDGYMKTGWPKKLKYSNGGEVNASVNSLVVSDLDNDGKYEIIVGAGTTSKECVWVYRHNGELMSGWPQLNGQKGTSYGVFMDGVAVGDITGNGKKDIIVATDNPFINAYDLNGKVISANPRVFNGRVWGEVGLWEDYGKETTKAHNNWNMGWGPNNVNGDRSDRFMGELGHSVIKIADVNNDGKNEVIASAVMVDRFNDGALINKIESSRYMSVFVFKGDRTRLRGWEKAPSSLNFMNAPLIQDREHMAAQVQAVPVISDLNNDGTFEILLNSYDGKVHAFSVKTPSKEYGNFPFAIPQHEGVIETPNEVVCMDINGDGEKEIIFTTNTRAASGQGEPSRKGSVFVLSGAGNLIMSNQLPDGYIVYETKKPAFTNTCHSAPVVTDLDKDGQYEIVINTKFSGICAFKIVGSKVKL